MAYEIKFILPPDEDDRAREHVYRNVLEIKHVANKTGAEIRMIGTDILGATLDITLAFGISDSYKMIVTREV